MTDQYRLSVGALDHGGYNITQCKLDFRIGMILPALRQNVIMETARFGGHRRQRHKTVTGVNVKHLRYRPGAVGGIEIAVALDGVLGAPYCLSLPLLAELRSGLKFNAA